MPPKKSDRSNCTGSPLGFEAKLGLGADKLRNNMGAAEYNHVLWAPSVGRWSCLQSSAKQPIISKIVNDAMLAIELDNPRLKPSLPKQSAPGDGYISWPFGAKKDQKLVVQVICQPGRNAIKALNFTQ